MTVKDISGSRRPSSRKRNVSPYIVKDYQDTSYSNIANQKPSDIYNEQTKMTLPKYSRGQKFEKEDRKSIGSKYNQFGVENRKL